MLKKRLLLLIPFTIMLAGCNPSGGEKPAPEEKFDPIINNIKQNEELALYDLNGGFVLTIRNQDYGDHFKYDLCVEDFSLGDYAQTFSDGVVSETEDKIVFNDIKVEKYSLFFPSTSVTFTISHSLSTDDIRVTFNNSVYQLSKTEVSRKYYQNPVTFGKWDYQDKFMITTSRDSFEITEGDITFTGSSPVHTEDNSNFTLTSTSNGKIFSNGDKVDLVSNGNTVSLKHNRVTYQLTVHDDTPELDYVDDYFTYDNFPKGKQLKYDTLTLTINTPAGPARWVRVTEGNYTKEAMWNYAHNSGALTRTYEDDTKTTGYIKHGVTYILAAVKENDSIVVRLIGDDNTNIIMSEVA
jgi:hypothetical protein